jgi:hypothetical protein
MESTILDIIYNSIDEDFWSEDSLLVDRYAEETGGEQLDCEMRSTSYNEDGKSISVTIGNTEYRVLVQAVHVSR